MQRKDTSKIKEIYKWSYVPLIYFIEHKDKKIDNQSGQMDISQYFLFVCEPMCVFQYMFLWSRGEGRTTGQQTALEAVNPTP